MRFSTYIILGVVLLVGVFITGIIYPKNEDFGVAPRVLRESQGGTATSTYVVGDILYSDATNKLGSLPIGTAGQVLEVSAGGIPEWDTDDTGAGGGAYAWTDTADHFGTNVSATGTAVWLQTGLYASTTAQFDSATTSDSISSNKYELGGSYLTAAWDSDATISLSGGALQCVDITCTDCLNATEIEDIYLLIAGDTSAGNYTLTGLWDFGGGDFEIPNGTNPTVDAIGEFAFDTTDNQLLIATSTEPTAPAVFPVTQKLWSATIASTSVDFVSGGSIMMPSHRDAVHIKEIFCSVESGTSAVINISSSGGTLDTETLTCDTNGASDTNITSNYSIGAGATTTLEFGTITGSVDYLSFSVWGSIVRE